MSDIQYGDGFSEPVRLTHREACRLSTMWNEHPDRGREGGTDFRINEFLKGLIAERLEAEGEAPAPSEHARAHALDVDTFERARSLHRIVRGMHDGECPKCHAISDSRAMRRSFESALGLDTDLVCPKCKFTITAEEQQAAINAFAPVMERNLAVFEEWRASRGVAAHAPAEHAS